MRRENGRLARVSSGDASGRSWIRNSHLAHIEPGLRLLLRTCSFSSDMASLERGLGKAISGQRRKFVSLQKKDNNWGF